MTERYLTLTGGSAMMEEVEVDHWFSCAGIRYAVVFKWHHTDRIFYVRAKAELMPVLTIADVEAA